MKEKICNSIGKSPNDDSILLKKGKEFWNKENKVVVFFDKKIV